MIVRWECGRCVPSPRRCMEEFNLKTDQGRFEIVVVRVECPEGHAKLVRVG